ncbi:SIR2 family protein [Sphingomonas yabuuchiae]|uniref:SIR2 family protein n=1 Tax=Sphingomonas yabuuchiae TaxID=172044 RepID=UPI003609403B
MPAHKPMAPPSRSASWPLMRLIWQPSSAQWPIEVKLHGDFRSRRLKNTPDELRQQDAQLREVLVDSCRRSGLVVGGYSGRDASIMDALEAALERPGAFPGGLFWLHRGEEPPFERVNQLLERAQAVGVDSGLVRIENLDEALRDLVRLLPDLDSTALDSLGQKQRWWTAAPALTGKHNWPLVRLNGIEVESIPTNARRVVCGIGGADVRDAILAAKADLIATRTSGESWVRLGPGVSPRLRPLRYHGL